ncbi:hypothetical protein HDU97_005198 [Phlyctochytrium planicorne]|nr:hypothetical protein HDU97_005198 [Phlyctochytrium planicorne]
MVCIQRLRSLNLQHIRTFIPKPPKAPIRQPIPNVKHVVCVSSAKGGVGKSTTAVNLSISLRSLGLKSGLLDADVFGPSIPTMMNLAGKANVNERNQLIPMINYGVKCMSMGFLIDEGAPVVWRGLMVMKGIQQLLWSVDWGPLDVLVIDMPPGTGDVQLSIAQQVKLAGAVIVSTPQDVALNDTMKGIALFQKMEVPILGMVQNMSFFECPNCKHPSHIFGHDGAYEKARSLGIEVIGDIPLSVDVCDGSDAGVPITIANKESSVSLSYLKLAELVKKALSKS